MKPIVRIALIGALALAAVACSGGAAPSDAPAGSPTPVASEPPASAPPSSQPGGEGSDPSDGVLPGEPGAGDSLRVDPQPGQQNVMAVPLEQIEASVDGRTVTLTLYWSSGVEPCSVLDQVLLDVGPGEVAVTIREGTSDPEAICVLMLQAKHTVVSLELDPGTWVIRDSQGVAPPVEVTVP